ncbi:hypothetical protein RCL_jg25700.t1 [Rhizophagus clarus]|uniref:Uncharacterized protein n=1 Tax=Rhizophagus clarus TaxID=94130 RepID=A0A8H3QWH6_9GLOM|nr:hypothetical protein RCL_jg25700.t1 [Rhizophagus clarus]
MRHRNLTRGLTQTGNPNDINEAAIYKTKIETNINTGRKNNPTKKKIWLGREHNSLHLTCSTEGIVIVETRDQPVSSPMFNNFNITVETGLKSVRRGLELSSPNVFRKVESSLAVPSVPFGPVSVFRIFGKIAATAP